MSGGDRRVAAVVLAAGASSRMGRPKALLPLDGTTFAERIAETARAAGVGGIVFVLGPPHGEAIRAALGTNVRVAWNPDPARGMLSSAQAGVAALQQEEEAALIWPVDLPLVAVETVAAIARAAAAGAIVAPQHEGRGGHPLGIPRRRFAELLALPPEQGLRALLQAHASEVARPSFDDPGTVRDVDTPADYDRLSRSRR